MHAFPCHTFKWVNSEGDATYVKYRFVPAAGIRNFTQAEAQRVSGIDPDFAKRELWQHIHAGNTADWIMQVQVSSAARGER